MNKSQYSYVKPPSCPSVWSGAFSSHLELKTPPPLFSQVLEMKRKEKWTQEQDGAVNRGFLAVLKYSSIGRGGKIAPPFSACTQGPLSSIFFHTNRKYSINVVLEEFWCFPLSIHRTPFFFLTLQPHNYRDAYDSQSAAALLEICRFQFVTPW